MNDIERIRRRIHKTDNKSRKFNRLYSCMIFIMFSLSLFMGGLIVTKTPVSELINKIEPYIDMQKLEALKQHPNQNVEIRNVECLSSTSFHM